ncbi:uncharacterized protein LOC118239346 [Cricetulus griseus]|uniref:Uncharacterized protein LOC118239346 n=1 Tax=Cricetulus griseus TaxID=10029 RepID=A0A9J7H5E6_CRIGR|nr:uncharacterized protein LOC118239346 [Cricetulus griseus]
MSRRPAQFTQTLQTFVPGVSTPRAGAGFSQGFLLPVLLRATGGQGHGRAGTSGSVQSGRDPEPGDTGEGTEGNPVQRPSGPKASLMSPRHPGISKKTSYPGAADMAQHLLPSQKTQVWFPNPAPASATPIPGNLMPSSGPLRQQTSMRYPGYASPIASMDSGLLFFLSVLQRAVSSAHPPVTVTVNGGSSLKVSFRVLWSQWWKANSSNVLMSSSAFGWLAAHRGENLSGSIEATPTAYGESHGSSNWPLASHLAAME